MADSKITKKHHPSGSLARRVLVICILLLVVPLFLQSLFLYRQEYNQKMEDFRLNLQVLAKERAHLIEEMIKLKWALLDGGGPNITPKNSAVSGSPVSVKTPVTETVPGGPVNVKRQYTTPVTEAVPGGPVNVKRLYIAERVPLPQGVADHFVIVSKSRSALLVGKKESNTTALILPIPFSELIEDLGTSTPIRVAIVDSKGKIFLENMKAQMEVLEVKESVLGTDLSFQITMSKEQIQALHLQNYLFRFATFLFFIALFGGGAVYLFTRRIAKPLRNLCKTMERVSEGATHIRYARDWMGFEINELGLQFNETLDALLLHAQEAERERLSREKLAEELRIGHEIQANLLPSHVPGLPGVDIATGYFAAKEVNGDFYDLFRLDDGRLLLAVCDTAGKGISACLFSLGLRSMIRSLANTAELGDLVRKVNDLYMIDAHESSMFSTLWLGMYDPNSRHLIYCSQGHPPALLKRGSQIEELWTGGIALGAEKFDVIPTKEIALAKGDLLLLYTDGVIEAHNPDGHLFGKKRLNDLLLSQRKETAQQTVDQIVQNVRFFSERAPQHDDMTLVAIRF